MYQIDKNLMGEPVALRAPLEVGTLEHLIAWLETQDPAKEYDYEEAQACALAQYARASGVTQRCWWWEVRHCGSDGDDNLWESELAKPLPRTFGGMLSRALLLQGHEVSGSSNPKSSEG